MKKLPLTICALSGVCSGFFPNTGLSDSLAIETTLSSEVAYRGLSETSGQPAIGVSLEWASANNLFAGATFSEGDVQGVQQRERAYSLYGGWQTKLAEDWTFGASVSYREFPGSTKEWDFVEYQSAIGWRDRLSLELAWSPNYYEHNTESFAVTARAFQPLTRLVYFGAEVGSVALSRDDFFDYQHASVSVGLRHDRWLTELSYTKATDEGSLLFGQPLEAPGLLLELSYQFR